MGDYKYRRRQRMRRRKRNYRKRNYVPNPSPTRPLTLIGFPQQRKVKLRYVGHVQLNPTTSLTAHRFGANGMFDPDDTGGGHQPLGFDQYAQFYNHYQVMGSRIKVTCTPTNQVAASAAVIWGISLSDGTTFSYTDDEHLLETGNTRYKILTLDNTHPSTQYATFSARNFFNLAASTDTSREDIGATFTQDPPELASFHVWFKSMAPLGDPPAIDILAEIDYVALLTEPKILDKS